MDAIEEASRLSPAVLSLFNSNDRKALSSYSSWLLRYAERVRKGSDDSDATKRGLKAASGIQESSEQNPTSNGPTSKRSSRSFESREACCSFIQYQHLDADLAAAKSLYTMPHRDGLDTNPAKFIYRSGHIRYDLDMTELSQLTQDPTRAMAYIGPKSEGFNAYFGSRYISSACLRSATNCLVSYFQCLISPLRSDLELLSIQSYTEALEDLRESLNGSIPANSPDILCALELCTLYEVFDSGLNRVPQCVLTVSSI